MLKGAKHHLVSKYVGTKANYESKLFKHKKTRERIKEKKSSIREEVD